jgi:uncharacterized protein
MSARDFLVRQFDRAILALFHHRRGRSLSGFFVLVLALSLPFWLLGAATGLQLLPGLPVSALMAFCPLMAAAILAYGEEGPGSPERLLKRAFDYERTERKVWYAPAILLMPAVVLLSYWVMRLIGSPLPEEPHIPLPAIPILLIAFLAVAASEELGWMGYAADPMQDRWSALTTGIVLGSVWSIWHAVPYVQAHRTLTWIAWQCLFSVAARVLIVWLYNNTGKSVLVAVLFHASINASVFLFPNLGSHYDPAIPGVLVAIAAAIVAFLWGPKTLARFRY